MQSKLKIGVRCFNCGEELQIKFVDLLETAQHFLELNLITLLCPECTDKLEIKRQ